jgi:hypothetical protein
MARAKDQKKPKRVQSRSKGIVVPKLAQAGEASAEPKRRSFRLLKRATKTKVEKQAAASERTKISSAYKLFVQTLGMLQKHWKLFLSMLVMYALVYFVLVGGVSEGGLSAVKATLNQTNANAVSKGVTLFSAVIGSAGNSSNASAGAYQTILVLVMSVVLIWAVRQVYAGHDIRARDAFYKGAYPLIPFMLVLLLVGIELLPMVIGGELYGLLMGGIAVGFLQKAVAVVIFFGLAAVSLYLVSSSLTALYIVTLPDMTPVKALKSARELVRYRRWIVLRKMLFLPLAMLLLGVIILIPLARYLTPLAPITFFGLAILALVVAHGYMYALYRELL